MTEPIIDPACDCPFPNNYIPLSRLLANGAWPEDIYSRNRRTFRGPAGRVARAVAEGFTPLLEALRYGSNSHPRRHLHPEVLERLLEGLSLAEVNAPLRNLGFGTGRTPLHHAAWGRGPGIVQLLLDSGALVEARDIRGWTPLISATSLESFRTLRAVGADIRAQSDAGYTVLHRAAWLLDTATVEALLADGLDPNARTDDGLSVLHLARSPETFEALREAGADIHAHRTNGYTVLHRAAASLDAATVKALIAAGLDPNAETSTGDPSLYAGSTPLLSAGSRETFEALLAGGADLGPIETVFTPDGLEAVRRFEIAPNFLYRAVHLVGRVASASLVERLRAINPDFAEVPDRNRRYALHYAAQFNEDPAMIAALSTDNVHATSESYGQTPFELAALYNGNPAVVEALLDAGARAHINRPRGGTDGPTPLYLAASNASPRAAEIVGVLLAAGAEVNGRAELTVATPPAPPPAPPPFQPQPIEVVLGDNGGTVTLMTTADGGFSLDDEAFAGGPDNPVEGEDGRLYILTLADGTWSARLAPPPSAPPPSLYRAPRAQNFNIPDPLPGAGVSPLYAAAMTQNVAAMELLLEAGANVNVTGSSEYQSLLADVLGRGRFDCGYAPVATALREAGAVSWRTVGEQRIPYVPGAPAVECETVSTEVQDETVSAEVQELIDSGADLDAQDSRSFTALHRAARDSQAVDIAALAAAGADVNATTGGVRLTPLQVAVWWRASLATVQALLDAEATVDATDLLGLTALHRAAHDRRTDPAVVAALLAAGANPNVQDNLGRTPLDHATEANLNNEAVADLLRNAGGTCSFCDAP